MARIRLRLSYGKRVAKVKNNAIEGKIGYSLPQCPRFLAHCPSLADLPNLNAYRSDAEHVPLLFRAWRALWDMGDEIVAIRQIVSVHVGA